MSRSNWAEKVEEQLTEWDYCQFPEYSPGAGERHLVEAIRLLVKRIKQLEKRVGKRGRNVAE